MPFARRSTPIALAALVLCLSLLAACSSMTAGTAVRASGQVATGSTQTPIDQVTAASGTISPPGSYAPGTEPTRPSAAPASDIKINNDTGGAGDTLAKDGLSDVIGYWTAASPSVFGKPLPPLEGGVWSIDPTSTKDKLPPHCLQSAKQVKNNAFYCPTDDSIVYDRLYLERISQDYSDLDVGMTFAHEFGHALQARFLPEQKSIVLETQADCFAGVWLKSVTEGKAPHFAFDPANLDRILGDYIWEMGDPAGYGPDAAKAHGSTFDRVSATQEGFLSGAGACLKFDSSRIFTAEKFTSANAGSNLNGNAGLDDTITYVSQLLDTFWTSALPQLGASKPFSKPNVVVNQSPDPSCSDQHIVSVCAKTSSVDLTPKRDLEGWHIRIGDFATASAMALAWAQYVQQTDQQLGTSAKARICSVGSFAAELFREGKADPSKAVLSPGDLDEAVRILVIAGKDNKLVDTGDTTAWDRLDAFRSGIFSGLGSCAAL